MDNYYVTSNHTPTILGLVTDHYTNSGLERGTMVFLLGQTSSGRNNNPRIWGTQMKRRPIDTPCKVPVEKRCFIRSHDISRRRHGTAVGNCFWSDLLFFCSNNDIHGSVEVGTMTYTVSSAFSGAPHVAQVEGSRPHLATGITLQVTRCPPGAQCCYS